MYLYTLKVAKYYDVMLADTKFTHSMGHNAGLTANLCCPTGTAQFQSCHDATGCGGNTVTGVSNASECCLGSGLSFRDGGTCRQCFGEQLIVFIRLLQPL